MLALGQPRQTLLKLGSGPDAVCLYGEVVLVHGDPEEAVLAPVGAPGVAANPVLLTLLVPPPAHHTDLVVDYRMPA